MGIFVSTQKSLTEQWVKEKEGICQLVCVTAISKICNLSIYNDQIYKNILNQYYYQIAQF